MLQQVGTLTLTPTHREQVANLHPHKHVPIRLHYDSAASFVTQKQVGTQTLTPTLKHQLKHQQQVANPHTHTQANTAASFVTIKYVGTQSLSKHSPATSRCNKLPTYTSTLTRIQPLTQLTSYLLISLSSVRTQRKPLSLQHGCDHLLSLYSI